MQSLPRYAGQRSDHGRPSHEDSSPSSQVCHHYSKYEVRNQEPLCDADWVGKEVRGDLKDLLLEVYSSPLLTRDNIVDNYKALIESGVSRHSIQIVVPMKTRGDACTLRINKDVQNYINAENHDTSILIGKEDESTSYELRLNDRVICTKNMYDAERPLKAGEDDLNIVPCTTEIEGLLHS